MANRVTIQDIADELGLSRNTVSKALNGGEGLADATRDRIIQKAVEMGYKQFAYSKAVLAAQQINAQTILFADRMNAHEIALFSASFLGGSHFASLMLDVFQNQIAKMGFTLSMHRVNKEMTENLELPITFRREHVGAIICFEMFDRAYDEMLCDLGLPILFVDGPAKIGGISLPADQLSMENSCGIIRIVNKAIESGKTRIGFIGKYDHCNSFFERYSGFRLAMGMAELPIDKRFIIAKNKRAEILEELVKIGELPELFVCANDFVALDALQALRSLGYDVPRDVWLSGFDDSGESRTSMPSLTTVHIHTQIMAVCAIDLLRTRMEEPSLEYRTIYTETDLIIRDSTPFS